MRFLVVEEQRRGCDYTIGCGVKTSIATGVTMEDVIERIHQEFIDTEVDARFSAVHGHAADTGHQIRSHVMVYEIAAQKSLPLADWREEWEAKTAAERAAAQEVADRAEYERLQKKFGK